METGNKAQEVNRKQRLDRTDWFVAAVVGIVSLAVYTRTLAPGVLYSDSAEFQTLAYTLGLTHPSGYPIYLLLAKLMTFLPVQNVAWRVNFVSAFHGALTLAVLYLLVSRLTRSRVGAILASVMLGIGYTFWSQAVIAEIYTTATLFLTVILFLLWYWHFNPSSRGAALFLACLMVGLGMHITVVILVPAVAIFTFMTLAALRVPALTYWRTILWAASGAAVGGVMLFLAFFALDLNNSPTSYIQVTLIPSRSAWGVERSDLDSPMERFSATTFGLQWRRSMFSGNIPFMLEQLKQYIKWALKYDLTAWVILLAFLGTLAILRLQPLWGGFLLIYGAVLLYLILNYEGPGKFVFYPSTYLLIAIAAGTGAGNLLDWFRQKLKTSSPGRFSLLYAAAVVLMTLTVVLPYGRARWQAVRLGVATFIEDENTIPVYNLQEPQQQAEQRLSQVEEDAVFVLDWKTLYATYYVAYIEQGRKGIRFLEDCVNRGDGLLADSLVAEIKSELQAGHPVYSDRAYSYLEQSFGFDPVPGTDLVRMTIK